eukprot:13635290-Alexandrium_andersonii.AAC.1
MKGLYHSVGPVGSFSARALPVELSLWERPTGQGRVQRRCPPGHFYSAIGFIGQVARSVRSE